MTRRGAARLTAAATLTLLGSISLGVPVAGAQAAEPGQNSGLALEPIGGYTDLANVRVLSMARCPAQSTSLIVRISGAGFPPDTNVMGNTEISNVPLTPDGSGYVAPIFADWEYLASAHDAKTPLDGEAVLTMLCADSDLERIDARMQGALRFQSGAGKKSTYLQDGGPRLATGISGIPEPGNGGVPKNAPTAPTVMSAGSPVATAATAARGTPATPKVQSTPVDGLRPPGAAQSAPDAGTGADGAPAAEPNGGTNRTTAGLQSTATQTTASGTGVSSTSIAVVAFAVLSIVSAIYLYVRRPSSNDPSTH